MTRFFDYVITACIILFIIMLVTGNGETLMRLFSGNSGQDMYKIYDRKRFDRACLLLLIVLLIDELVLIFLGSTYPVLGLVSVVITIVTFALFIFYIRKYAKK